MRVGRDGGGGWKERGMKEGVGWMDEWVVQIALFRNDITFKNI